MRAMKASIIPRQEVSPLKRALCTLSMVASRTS